MRRRTLLAGAAGLSLARIVHAGSPRRKVKVGQIGVGHAHAGGKMDALRRLTDDFEVVGIVEPDAARRAAAQSQPVYKNLRWLREEELLATPGLEAVVVETTVADLVPTARRCVAAGMHLHLDKPAGESLAAYRELLDEATRRGRHVQMGFMFRHNPAFRRCFQAVRAGWLGSIFEVHGVISSSYKQPQRQPLLPYRGGTMFELGCHLIDALVAVLGPPTAVQPFLRRHHAEWDALPDNQLAVFEYPRATATIRSSLVEVGPGPRRQFVVCGDGGTFEIRPLEPPAAEITLSSPQGGLAAGRQKLELPSLAHRYDDHLIELARIVRGEKSPEYTVAHDLAVHRAVLLAADLAAA